MHQSGWELNDTTADAEWSSAGGTYVTSPNRTGVYSGRCVATAGTQFFRQHIYTSDQNTVAWLRVYFHVVSLPSSGNTTILRFQSTANDGIAQVRLSSTGAVSLLDSSAVVKGSASSAGAVATGTFYRLELANDPSGTLGAIQARLYADTAPFSLIWDSGVQANDIKGSWARIVGGLIASTTAEIILDDLALNDDTGSTANSWCGPGGIYHLVPNADGDAHAWLQTAGGAGSSTNCQLIDEVPISDSDYVKSGTASNADYYNVTDTPSGIGANDTVLAVMVGARYANETAADATTAFKIGLKSASGGTILQSAAIIPNSTSFKNNANAQPKTYPIITSTKPAGGAWTKTDLDVAQIGLELTAANVRLIRVSGMWLSVDVAPAAATAAPPPSPMKRLQPLLVR